MGHLLCVAPSNGAEPSMVCSHICLNSATFSSPRFDARTFGQNPALILQFLHMHALQAKCRPLPPWTLTIERNNALLWQGPGRVGGAACRQFGSVGFFRPDPGK